MGKYFNWPPFVQVALDADTGKPLDPNVGMRVYREFYKIGEDSKGRKAMIAHKSSSRAASNAGGAEKTNGDSKKNGNGKESGGKAVGREAKKDNGGGGGDGEHRGQDVPFTDEEDAKLKQMKTAGRIWADIAEELHRSKSTLQKRWKEINPDGGNAANNNNNNGGEKKQDAGKGKEQNAKKGNKGEGNNGGNKGANNDNGAEKKKDAGDKGKDQKASKKEEKAPSEARFTMGEWLTLQEDDMFGFGELQCLSELILRDDRQRWLRIASAFYEKTGRRVHPEDIHEKFAEMDAMGN